MAGRDYGLITATFTGIVCAVFVFFFFRPDYFSRLIYLYAGILIVLLLTIERIITRLILNALRRRGLAVHRALIVGCGETGRAILRNVIAQPGLGYQIEGYIDDDPLKLSIGPFQWPAAPINCARFCRPIRSTKSSSPSPGMCATRFSN